MLDPSSMSRSSPIGARLRAGAIAAIASSAVACSLSLGGTGPGDDDAGDDASPPIDGTAADTTLPPVDGGVDAAFPPDALGDAPADAGSDARANDAAMDSAPADSGVDGATDAASDGDASACTTEATCAKPDDVCLGMRCVACGASGSQNLDCKGGGKCHETQAVCM